MVVQDWYKTVYRIEARALFTNKRRAELRRARGPALPFHYLNYRVHFLVHFIGGFEKRQD